VPGNDHAFPLGATKRGLHFREIGFLLIEQGFSSPVLGLHLLDLGFEPRIRRFGALGCLAEGRLLSVTPLLNQGSEFRLLFLRQAISRFCLTEIVKPLPLCLIPHRGSASLVAW
jgi:hypothetical protein